MHEASDKAARHTAPRTAPRATAYTGHRPRKAAHVRTGASSGYSAAYKSGYTAGRAAGLRQSARKSSCLKSAGRPSQPLQAGKTLFKTRAIPSDRPAAIDQATRPTIDAPAVHRPADDQPTGNGKFHAAAYTPAATEAAETPAETETASLPLRLTAMPSTLRGSLATLERQNTRLDAEGLERIEDEDDLSGRIANKLLVPLPASAALTVNLNLPEHHRYCRPWTARFLTDLARAHEAAFHKPLEVSSAVRTVEYQKRLMAINGNAAPAEGDIVSPHLTGSTIDIAKDGLNRQEMAWMRRRLMGLEEAGKIDVEEEFEQACFHITVYKSYAPPRTPRRPLQAAAGPGTRRGTGQPGASRPAAHKPAGQLPAEIAASAFPIRGR